MEGKVYTVECIAEMFVLSSAQKKSIDSSHGWVLFIFTELPSILWIQQEMASDPRIILWIQ